jgi:6-phosphogluconolactonase
MPLSYRALVALTWLLPLGCSEGAGSPAGSTGGAGASGAPAGGGSSGGGAGSSAGDASGAGAAGAGNGGAGAGGSAGSATAGSAGSTTEPSATSFLYVSGYAPPITTFTLTHATGALSPGSMASTGEGGEPTFIAFSPDKRFAYAIDEQLDGPLASVIAFSVNQQNGALSEINREDVGTPVNANAGVHPSGKWVLSANYGGDSVTVFPVREDGGLEPGMTPVPAGVRAHQIVFEPSGKVLFVPCLEGHVAVFDFDAGKLTPRSPARVEVDGGARHMAFTPDQKFAYVLTQNESTITQFAYDAAAFTLTPVETVDAAPNGGALSAHIYVHPSGKFLYASNRSDDSVAMFRLDAATGKLTNIGYQRQSLQFPRFFAIDPSGRWLVIASQDSAEILMHRIDQDTGLLEVVGSPLSVPAKPTFVGFLAIP